MLTDYENALKYIQDAEIIILKNNIKVKETDLYSFYGEVYCGLGKVELAMEYMNKQRKDYLAIKKE